VTKYNSAGNRSWGLKKGQHCAAELCGMLLARGSVPLGSLQTS